MKSLQLPCFTRHRLVTEAPYNQSSKSSFIIYVQSTLPTRELGSLAVEIHAKTADADQDRGAFIPVTISTPNSCYVYPCTCTLVTFKFTTCS